MRTAAMARLVSSRRPKASEMAPLTTSSRAASAEIERRKARRSSCRRRSAAVRRRAPASASSSRACARRAICCASWLTSTTMRPASIWKLDQLLGERGGLRIERGGRLVEQQHARLVGDGADQPQPLALAGRQLGYRPVEQRRLERQRRKQPVELGVGGKCSRAVPAPPGGLGRGIAHAAAPLRAPAPRAARRLRARRSPRRRRGRRSRAAAASCRSPTGPRRPGIPAPPPRRRAQAAPAPTDSRSSASQRPLQRGGLARGDHGNRRGPLSTGEKVPKGGRGHQARLGQNSRTVTSSAK